MEITKERAYISSIPALRRHLRIARALELRERWESRATPRLTTEVITQTQKALLTQTTILPMARTCGTSTELC